MKPIIRVLSGLSLAIFAAPSIAALNIFACEQEWAALAQELAGDKASVYSATTALQDVHKVEARPSLIARERSADLLICSGSELEVGWLPLLPTQSCNAKIKLGTSVYFKASQSMHTLEHDKHVER